MPVPSNSPQDRPGDRLLRRDPADGFADERPSAFIPRVAVVSPRPVAHIPPAPEPWEPWVADARHAAAGLRCVAAYEASACKLVVPSRPTATRLPGMTRGAWVMLVLALALVCGAFAYGGGR